MITVCYSNMWKFFFKVFIIILYNKLIVEADKGDNYRIVLIAESVQSEMVGWFNDSIHYVSNTNPDLANLQSAVVLYTRENEEESYKNFCKTISEGVSLIVDTTWNPWGSIVNLADYWSIPLVAMNIGEGTVVLDGLIQFLHSRGANDVLFIFEKEQVLLQALYRILGNTLLRIMVISDFQYKINNLKSLRPIPGYVVLLGSTDFLAESYKVATREGLVFLPDRWVLCSTDLKAHRLDVSILKEMTFLLSMTSDTSCALQGVMDSCSDDDERFKIELILMNSLMRILTNTLLSIDSNNNNILAKQECNVESSANGTKPDSEIAKIFSKALNHQISGRNESLFYFSKKSNILIHRAELILQVNTRNGLQTVTRWFSNDNIPRINMSTPTRFFRIGTTTAVPWTYPSLDHKTGKPMFTTKGQMVYEGYCIDLITKLAEIMDFDYEITSPRRGDFGQKYSNGSWDGLIGDLVDGEIDFAVAALIMTSQREEVVDFVAPYFDQSGFTIVIRKPARKTSLFKFMTVLRVEVWLSIVAALTLTAILLTILDVYSPYSARNNKDFLSQYSREFTIKESIWFTLTSFTPQGGGEAPRSLSGRTLVAAYWLFVVLMLATFTANLAAFLTVERLQSPVSSLEQLARQSRINYTVVEGSPAHHYFLNMKNAEDILYRVWREITMNASSDELQYQVWDYPIREQYGHIVLAINASQPVPNAREGFRKVDQTEESDFAFIHDSAEIKYEISRNCNLTMVGDVFGERPYAIAIQQGSRIQEELAQALLQMQKSRYLDDLIAKYWNNTCSDSDDSEGITLDSLGGVFIATLFGLALAMVTLVWEIFYYKRKENNLRNVKEYKTRATKNAIKSPMKAVLRKIIKKDKKSVKVVKSSVTIGNTFKPVAVIKKPKIQFINVEPIDFNP